MGGFWVLISLLWTASGLQPRRREVLGPLLNAANYPSFQDPACNSNGTYLCDPAGILSEPDRLAIAQELTRLRELNLVTCGRLQQDPVDPTHLQPFYLGIVVGQGWPESMQNTDTMQSFGQVVASIWNMNLLYVGEPKPFLECPTTAMLILLPDSQKAFLSSESCEFTCDATGSVSKQALEGLRTSPAAAVLAAIRETYSQIATTQVAAGAAAAGATAKDAQNRQNGASNVLFFQRVIFFFSVIALGCSAIIGLVVLVLAPGLFARTKK